MTDLIKKQTCKSCKFFDRNATEASEGSCREGPPQLTVVLITQHDSITGRMAQVPTPLAAWPNVSDEMWCGRYGAKWAGLNS